MQILLNGEPRVTPQHLGLSALIVELKLGGRLAVELNGVIVPRSTWAQVFLTDGDRLEIVHAIGGG